MINTGITMWYAIKILSDGPIGAAGTIEYLIRGSNVRIIAIQY